MSVWRKCCLATLRWWRISSSSESSLLSRKPSHIMFLDGVYRLLFRPQACITSFFIAWCSQILAKRSITRKEWLLWSCGTIADLVLLSKPLGATADQYFRVPRVKNSETSCSGSVHHGRYRWSKVSKSCDCRDRGSTVWVFWWGKIVVEVNFDLRLKSSSWLTLFEEYNSHSQNGLGVYFSWEGDGLTIRSRLS